MFWKWDIEVAKDTESNTKN